MLPVQPSQYAPVLAKTNVLLQLIEYTVVIQSQKKPIDGNQVKQHWEITQEKTIKKTKRANKKNSRSFRSENFNKKSFRKGPKKSLLNNQIMYTAPKISPTDAKRHTSGLTENNAKIIRSSAVNEAVPGKPKLANTKTKKKKVYTGII